MKLSEIINKYKKDVINKKYNKVTIGFSEFGNDGQIIIEESGEVTITGDLNSHDLERKFSFIKEKIINTSRSSLKDEMIETKEFDFKLMTISLNDIVKNWTVLKLLSYASESFREPEVHIAINKKRIAIVRNGTISEIFENKELIETINKITIRIVGEVAYINVIG